MATTTTRRSKTVRCPTCRRDSLPGWLPSNLRRRRGVHTAPTCFALVPSVTHPVQVRATRPSTRITRPTPTPSSARATCTGRRPWTCATACISWRRREIGARSARDEDEVGARAGTDVLSDSISACVSSQERIEPGAEIRVNYDGASTTTYWKDGAPEETDTWRRVRLTPPPPSVAEPDVKVGPIAATQPTAATPQPATTTALQPQNQATTAGGEVVGHGARRARGVHRQHTRRHARRRHDEVVRAEWRRRTPSRSGADVAPQQPGQLVRAEMRSEVSSDAAHVRRRVCGSTRPHA